LHFVKIIDIFWWEMGVTMASIRTIKLKRGTAHELTYYLNRQRHRVYFPPEIPASAVQAERLRIEREILLNKTQAKQLDIPILTKKITLSELECWYRAQRANDPIAPSTLIRYCWAIRAFARAIGPATPLFHVKTEHIQAFKAYQLAHGKTEAGINKDIHHLSHPLKLAKQHGLLLHDIHLTKFKVYKGLPDFLMPEELHHLFQHLPSGEVELACHIIKWTGIRRTELIERTCKNDFNFRAGYLMIHGKNSVDRTAPLHPDLVAYLKTNPIFQSKQPEETIFSIQPGSISDGIRKAKQRAGITKKGRTHLLRHTLGVNLINNGYDLKEVQYILGHKTLYMTNLYTQIVNAKIKKKFDTFQYEISEK
jgi:site-specific recombinase XerD